MPFSCSFIASPWSCRRPSRPWAKPLQSVRASTRPACADQRLPQGLCLRRRAMVTAWAFRRNGRVTSSQCAGAIIFVPYTIGVRGNHECRGHWVHAHMRCSGAVYDTWARILLWGPWQAQERGQQHPRVRLHHRARDRAVGRRGLLARVRSGQRRRHWRLRVRDDEWCWCLEGGPVRTQHPVSCVRRWARTHPASRFLRTPCSR